MEKLDGEFPPSIHPFRMKWRVKAPAANAVRQTATASQTLLLCIPVIRVLVHPAAGRLSEIGTHAKTILCGQAFRSPMHASRHIFQANQSSTDILLFRSFAPSFGNGPSYLPMKCCQVDNEWRRFGGFRVYEFKGEMVELRAEGVNPMCMWKAWLV